MHGIFIYVFMCVYIYIFIYIYIYICMAGRLHADALIAPKRKVPCVNVLNLDSCIL